jgi:hypothetical protein
MAPSVCELAHKLRQAASAQVPPANCRCAQEIGKTGTKRMILSARLYLNPAPRRTGPASIYSKNLPGPAGHRPPRRIVPLTISQRRRTTTPARSDNTLGSEVVKGSIPGGIHESHISQGAVP